LPVKWPFGSSPRAKWPKPLAPDNKAYVALAFWASDYVNLYLVQVDSGGGINLWRKSGGTWATIGDLSNPKVKPVPGSLVTLRVVAKGNLIVPILDGVELEKTRPPQPEIRPLYSRRHRRARRGV
jgi:hypothetical protein